MSASIARGGRDQLQHGRVFITPSIYSDIVLESYTPSYLGSVPGYCESDLRPELYR